MIVRVFFLAALLLPDVARATARELVLLRAVPVEGETLKLEDRMRHYGVPGLSIAVWKNGKLDWSEGYGSLRGTTAAKVAGTTIAAQSAPGFSILSVGTPEDGAVLIANHEDGLPLLREIARGLGSAPPPRKLSTVDVEPFAGRYAFDADDVVRFRFVNGRLVATRTGVPREAPLDAVGPNELVDRDTGTTYVFANDSVTVDGITATRTRESIPTERIERDAKMVVDFTRLDSSLLTEERLRARGEMYLARRNYGAALAILQFNAERHPESAAAHDALATAQLAMNDAAGARASSQKVLELLPKDTTVRDSWRPFYRKRAEERVSAE